MSEKDLEKNIETYRELGKENPNVDVSMLMVSALQNESGNKASSKSYRMAYLISLGLPLFGLIYAIKYYFSDDESDKQAAKICLLLTIVSVIVIYIFGKLIFSGSNTSLQQIEQIKPQDIQQLGQ
jgi:dipeptide/tripeptide permease